MTKRLALERVRRIGVSVLASLASVSCGGETSMPSDAKLTPVAVVEGPSGTIAYHTAGIGSAVPVVFVHSLAGSMNQWNRQIGHLRASRRVAAMDLRGHGGSAPPGDGLYTPEAMSGDVLAVADALDMPRFVLVGHSYGGSVAVAFAGMHPKRVSGLLLVDPNGDVRSLADDQLDTFITELRSPEYELKAAARWDAVLEGALNPVRRAVMDDLRHTPKATVVGAFEAMGTFDPMTHLAKYDGPKFSIVTPMNDNPMSLHRKTTLDYRVVGDTSHWLQMDKPDVVNAVLDEFLGRIDRRERTGGSKPS
jgi:pimeloyl-ACP methyl ester carboxylesterase